MNNEKRVLIYLVNSSFKVVSLLRKYHGMEVGEGGTIHCPFHDDRRKSAKIYSDNAIFCFTESKMYRPYDIFRYQGLTDAQIKMLLPEGIFSPQRKEKEIVNVDEIRSFFLATNNLEETVQRFYKLKA